MTERNASQMKSLLACTFYAFTSISITFANKAVLAPYEFTSPNIMTLVQMLFSLFFLVTMKAFRLIDYPSINWQTSVHTSPLSISFCGMVVTGLAALKYLNIPMYNSLRRITTLLTMIGESYLLNVRSSTPVQLSVWLMMFGALIASVYDFDFSMIGYILVALNCVFTAAYLLSIAKLGKQGLNTFGLMYYNNLQSIPFVLVLCYFNCDFDELATYKYRWDTGFWICFLFQSALAFLLNYSIFLCTNINSALATSVTGQIKNVATTAVGYFTFKDVTYDPFNVFGLIVGVVASAWYSWLKYVESEKAKKPVLPTSNVEETEPLHGHSHSHGSHGHSHSHGGK